MIDKLTKTYVFQLKVSDSLLFLLNATHPLDSFGDKCLSCIFAQGLPTSFLGVQVCTFTLCVLIFFFFFFDLWVSSQYVGKCFKSLFLGLFAHYSGGIVCMRKVLERSVVSDCTCKWKFDKVKGHHYHSTCTQIFETSLTVTNVNVYNLFQGLEEVPSKKRNDVKKHIQKIVEKRYMSVSTMLFLIKTLLISFW